MKKKIFNLVLSAAIFTTNPVFAMEEPSQGFFRVRVTVDEKTTGEFPNRGAVALAYGDGGAADGKTAVDYYFRGPEALARFSLFKPFGCVEECDLGSFDEKYKDQWTLSIQVRGERCEVVNKELLAPKAGMCYTAHLKNYGPNLSALSAHFPAKIEVEWLEAPLEDI